MPVQFNQARLLELRLDLGYTQAEAAQALGIDVTTYRDYESGRVNHPGHGFEVRRLRRRNILLAMAALFELADPNDLLIMPSPTPRSIDPSMAWMFLLFLVAADQARDVEQRGTKADLLTAAPLRGRQGERCLQRSRLHNSE